MRDGNLQKAEATLDKLRQDIAEHEFAVRSSVLQITISIEVARLTSARNDEETIHSADEALYMAKSCGRNQVVSELKLNKSNA
jgi:diguanylate cyclase (GGDEF)-like protein